MNDKELQDLICYIKDQFTNYHNNSPWGYYNILIINADTGTTFNFDLTQNNSNDNITIVCTEDITISILKDFPYAFFANDLETLKDIINYLLYNQELFAPKISDDDLLNHCEYSLEELIEEELKDF